MRRRGRSIGPKVAKICFSLVLCHPIPFFFVIFVIFSTPFPFYFFLLSPNHYHFSLFLSFLLSFSYYCFSCLPSTFLSSLLSLYISSFFLPFTILFVPSLLSIIPPHQVSVAKFPRFAFALILSCTGFFLSFPSSVSSYLLVSISHILMSVLCLLSITFPQVSVPEFRDLLFILVLCRPR